MAAFIVGEGNWLPMAMTAALLACAVVYARTRTLPIPRRSLTMAIMNLFVGVTITVMGAGHLLAVTTKLLQGTLRGSPLVLYPIGIAIIVPSLLIVRQTRVLLRDADRGGAVTLNGWLAATLLALGLVNTPLAVPGFLNIAYRLHSRRAAGVAIVVLSVLVNTGLLVGGLVFLASGAQTFEEFSGGR